MVDKNAVVAAIEGVVDPDLRRPIGGLGMVALFFQRLEVAVVGTLGQVALLGIDPYVCPIEPPGEPVAVLVPRLDAVSLEETER